MNQTGWKDRGWWLSVEINKKASGKKNHAGARKILDTASERYDLLLDSGKTMARGIFTREADMNSLSRLLNAVNRWTDTMVVIRGKELGGRELAMFSRLLLCAARSRPCSKHNGEGTPEYLGCPLNKIGLMNYSLADLKNGARYWFSFFKPETDSAMRFYLDKNKLANTMIVHSMCPLFPQNTVELLDLLPTSVNLSNHNQRHRWVMSRYRIRSRWLCRFPPLVPYSETVYRKWMKNLIGSNGCKNE